jgi:hypothetical protein
VVLRQWFRCEWLVLVGRLVVIVIQSIDFRLRLDQWFLEDSVHFVLVTTRRLAATALYKCIVEQGVGDASNETDRQGTEEKFLVQQAMRPKNMELTLFVSQNVAWNLLVLMILSLEE